MTRTPAQIAAGLTKAQREALISDGVKGNRRGLVARGLFRYRWGNDPSFGYVTTPLGLAVRELLKGNDDEQ
jgi:hypothetical protein